jgi:hypothetical protein
LIAGYKKSSNKLLLSSLGKLDSLLAQQQRSKYVANYYSKITSFQFVIFSQVLVIIKFRDGAVNNNLLKKLHAMLSHSS